MRVLITNDDGVHAEGLLALKRALDPVAEVTIVAPDRPRSGRGKPFDTPNIDLRRGSFRERAQGLPPEAESLAGAILRDVPGWESSGATGNRTPIC